MQLYNISPTSFNCQSQIVEISHFLDRMASTAAPKDAGAFKTPKSVRVRSFDSNGGTPVTIPASPFMKKLGCGTGVNVYLMDRWVVSPKLAVL